VSGMVERETAKDMIIVFTRDLSWLRTCSLTLSLLVIYRGFVPVPLHCLYS
jgi:hypothetical protein